MLKPPCLRADAAFDSPAGEEKGRGWVHDVEAAPLEGVHADEVLLDDAVVVEREPPPVRLVVGHVEGPRRGAELREGVLRDADLLEHVLAELVAHDGEVGHAVRRRRPRRALRGGVGRAVVDDEDLAHGQGAAAHVLLREANVVEALEALVEEAIELGEGDRQVGLGLGPVVVADVHGLDVDVARGEAGARDEDDDGEDRDVGGVQKVDAVEVHLDDDARVPRDRGLHLREAQDPQQEVVEVAGRPDARDAAVVVELEREVLEGGARVEVQRHLLDGVGV